jgi:hypothetical protein
MDLVPILPTHFIHALDTTLDIYVLRLYHPKLVKHFPLEPCLLSLIVSSSFPGLRVSRLLEVFSSTPPNLVLPYKLNAVDYMGNTIVDFLRYGTMRFGVASTVYSTICLVA